MKNTKQYDKNCYLVFTYWIYLGTQVVLAHSLQQGPLGGTGFFHIHNHEFGEVTPHQIHEADFDLNVITEDLAINLTLHIHTQIY